jgi:hypothetical protein
LFDVLIKLGKPFESQIYPGEILPAATWCCAMHGAPRRVFDRTVKNGRHVSSK